ncbi:MAG: ABC transporter substrate-binding protein [Oscillospiraceae bacterium]|nr:ABC transporter substrate-binding protein [Oscillospiraceae bacterium]MCL2277983.1 ABC transporter substrate-binding protein [Oscillospiraceae bacterium]
MRNKRRLFFPIFFISASVLLVFVVVFTAFTSDSEAEPLDNNNLAAPGDSKSRGYVYYVWGDGSDVQIIGLPTGEYTYVLSEIVIADNLGFIQALAVSDGTLYGAASFRDESVQENTAYVRFFSVCLDTGEVSFYPLPTDLDTTEGNREIIVMAANDDGDIIFLCRRGVWYPERSEYVTLTRIDKLGNIRFSVDVTEAFGGFEQMDWHGQPTSLVLDHAENIYVQAGNGNILLFDSAGVYEHTIPRPETAWRAGEPFMGTDGTMQIAFLIPDEGSQLFTIDNDTRSLIPLMALPHSPSHYTPRYIPGSRENELFFETMAGVYSFCLVTEEQERVFHWLDLGMPHSGRSLVSVNENHFALIMDLFSDTITILTRTAVEADDRTVITLASFHPNLSLINDFNQQSADYRIVLIDYSEFGGSLDTDAAMTRFNIDMIAGRIPDIIDLSGLDYSVLANAGFLADLNPWFEQDSQISRGDFIDRVFELLEVDGNLYAVAQTFFVSTFIAPASLVGTSPGITLERLIQLDEQFNNGYSLLELSPEHFVGEHWVNSRNTLVDYQAGTAHFETDAFLQVLEYAKRLERADMVGETVRDRVREHPIEIEFRRGNKSISSIWIHNLTELHNIEMLSGVDITAIGFPVAEGVGSRMIPYQLYAMGYGTQNQTGAWEFIRFMLEHGDFWAGIPTSRTRLNEKFKWMMTPGSGEIVENGAGKIMVDGVLVELVPMSQNHADRFMEMLNTLGTIQTGGEEIIRNIITEVADDFFRGNSTAEDAARIIQSRVQTYVWEQQR